MLAATSQPPAQVDRRKWAIVGLLFVAVLINYIDRGNLSIVAVPLMKDFGISTVSLGTLLSAFFWTYTFLQIPVGFMVDRFGLKWAYAIAFLIWSLASAAVGIASSFGQILAFRLLLGVGESVAQPASLAYIRQNFDEDQQGLPSAIYLAGMMIGPATGAFVGAAMLESMDWRSLFIYTGLGGLVWLIPWIWLMPSSSAKPKRVATQILTAPIGLAPLAVQSDLLGHHSWRVLLFLLLVFLSDLAAGLPGPDTRAVVSEDGRLHRAASHLYGNCVDDRRTCGGQDYRAGQNAFACSQSFRSEWVCRGQFPAVAAGCSFANRCLHCVGVLASRTWLGQCKLLGDDADYLACPRNRPRRRVSEYRGESSRHLRAHPHWISGGRIQGFPNRHRLCRWSTAAGVRVLRISRHCERRR